MPNFVTSKGLRIHFQVHGTFGPPLVMLHGLGSSGKLWAPQLPDFKKHFQVFTLDYPGHGRSQWARQYSIQELSDIVKEFIDYIGLEKVHFLGLSLGCAVALTLSTQYPERVSSLVLQGPVGGLTPRKHPAAIGKIAVIRLYLGILFAMWKLKGKTRAIEFINRHGYQTYGYYPFLVAMQKKVDPLAVWHLAQDIMHPPYIGKLACVQVPTMIIMGKGDITPKRYYNYIRDNIGSPCDLTIIPEARHIASVEKYAEFNQRVLYFHQQLIPVASKNPPKNQSA